MYFSCSFMFLHLLCKREITTGSENSRKIAPLRSSSLTRARLDAALVTPVKVGKMVTIRRGRVDNGGRILDALLGRVARFFLVS